MPIDPRKYDEPELLSRLRHLYAAARSRNAEVRREMSDTDRFHDGYQWTEQDLDVLRDQRRPALVVNMVAPKIQSLVGMYADSRMTPIVTPKGAEDKARADLRNRLLEALRQQMQREQLDVERYETHLVMGEEDVMLQVEPDHENPTWLHMEIVQLDPRDVDWDPSCRRKDYSDAEYVTASRWIGKTRFLNLHPDKEDTFDELLTKDSDEFFDGDVSEWSPLERRGPEDYHWGIWSRREQKQVRLINIQWKCRVWKWHLIDLETGDAEEIDAKVARAAEDAIENGDAPDSFQVIRAHDIVTYEAEFVGTELLTPKREILEPRPMSGFSIHGSACYMERTSGRPFGAIRHLMDPQRDLNKGVTMSNEAMSGQGRTGWIAETDAVDNPNQFERDVQRSGSVALVNNMQGVRERIPNQLSPAVEARIGRTVEFIDGISNVVQAAESPARAAEAAATVALREKKSLRGYQASRDTFDHVNMRLDRTMLEVIARAMPTSQIMALLADPERYQLQGDVIVDMEEQAQIAIKDLRELDFDVDLQAGGESQIARLTTLNLMTQLVTTGLPVDPELMLELAAENPSMRERLVEYARDAQEAQQQAAMGEQQQQAALLGAQAQAQASIGQAQLMKAQADQAKVASEAEGDAADRALKHFQIVLEAYLEADANEKAMIQRQMEAALRLQTMNTRGVMPS